MNLKPYLLTGMLVLTTALDWPDWMGDPAEPWAPLSDEEIADAHTCMMDTMLAICAGEKRIATGLIIASRLHGKSLSRTAPVNGYRFFPMTTPNTNSWSVDAQITFYQKATDTQQEWNQSYYVINDQQLARIIARARADPDFDPTPRQPPAESMSPPVAK